MCNVNKVKCLLMFMRTRNVQNTNVYYLLFINPLHLHWEAATCCHECDRQKTVKLPFCPSSHGFFLCFLPPPTIFYLLFSGHSYAAGRPPPIASPLRSTEYHVSYHYISVPLLNGVLFAGK